MIRILFLLVLSCCVQLVAGAQDRFPFRELSKRNGLSQNSVIAIAQDGKGFMWFGTRDGLNRYDGDEFRVYRKQRDPGSGLIFNDIRSLYFDAAGERLWVGTTRGLCRYRQETDDFVAYGDSSDFAERFIHFVGRFADGGLYVGTDRGLYRHDEAADRFERIRGLPQQAYRVMAETERGGRYLGTPRGLFELVMEQDGKRGRLLPLSLDTGEPGREAYVQDLLPEPGGHLWVATRFSGLYRVDLAGDGTARYTAGGAGGYRLSDNNVRDLAWGQDGRLWAGTFVGLNCLLPEGDAYVVNDPIRGRLKHLSNHSIHSLFRDRRGTLWLGSYFGGVAYYDRRLEGISHFSREGTGLRSSVVSAFAETPAGDFWVGTEGGGLHFYDRRADTLYPIDTGDELESNNIKTLLLDGSRLWIGTYQGQLVYLDTTSGRIVRDWPFAPDSVRRELTNVYDLLLRNDTLWIANYGKSLTLLDLRGGGATTVSRPDGTLPSTECRDLYEDSRGGIWMATQQGTSRIVCRPGDGFHFTHYLPEQVVNALGEDRTGRMWAGTYGQGLYIIHPEQGTVEHYEDEAILAESTVYSLLRDTSGALWMSSSRGVAGQDRQTGHFRTYDTPLNLLDQEYRINAACASRYNELIFGGTEGMTFFDGTGLATDPQLPTVLFTKLQVANQEVRIAPHGSLLSKNIDATDRLTLPYDNANFSLSFAPLDFLTRDRYRYAYRLEGLDENWVNSEGRTTVGYTLQNAGTYRFRLRVYDGGRADAYVERSLEVRVLPPPWRSGYAYVAYLILAGLLVAAVSRYAYLRHRLREEERNQGQQEELHQAKLRFFTNITHELRTPLTLMVGPLESVRRSGEVSGEAAKRLLTVEKNSWRLLQLVNELLTFRKFNGQSDPLRLDAHDVVEFCQDTTDAFQAYAATSRKQLTFLTDVDQQIVRFDRDKLEKVVYNLLANAFKFTGPGGRVTLLLRCEGPRVVLEVRDDGEGIPEDLHQKIFARFFERASLTKREGTGIGLAIAREYVEMHGGEINVSSRPGQGSTFTLWIPLRPPIGEWFAAEPYAEEDAELALAGLYPAETEAPEVDAGPPPLVLIVEDNEEVRDYIESVLVNDYRLLTAPNGKEGLRLAREQSPDLVVSDVMMPVMDGIALCAALRQELQTSHLPIILLTAKSSDLHRLKGLETGANDYLTKPFSPRELQLRVRNLLRSIRSAREQTGRTLRLEPANVEVASADAAFLERAIAAVQNHMDDTDYRVDHFARDLAVSRALLFTKVKAITGHTPNNFIKLLRMKRAAQLLASGELLVSEVAARVGYRDVKYFSASFAKEHGCNPSAYDGCKETT